MSRVAEAARLYAEAVERRDSLPPEAAALEAGARTPGEVAALAARIRAARRRSA